MSLPEAFIDQMRQCLPASELEDFLRALQNDDCPTSIRWNSEKLRLSCSSVVPHDWQTTDVPWCPTGSYLAERPQFTLDPLLHGGLYYVQEASSQFLAHVVRHICQLESQNSDEAYTPMMLDLCAAPGGKSTAALSVLPEGSVLVSNEIDRKRARVLAENIQKWGNPNVCVTANAPADFKRLGETFDVIIADVPCSGEGMFRKDAGAIGEWTPAKVRECAALQKSIVSDAWHCLKAGGYMVYSTCTFNMAEDEENLQYIHDELGGEVLTIPIETAWNIHPALTNASTPALRPESACRFMPHYTRGEGLFMALVHKPEATKNSVEKSTKSRPSAVKHSSIKDKMPDLSKWLNADDFTVVQDKDGNYLALSSHLRPLYDRLTSANLYLLSAGVELGAAKGKDIIPAHALALSTALCREAFPMADLDLETALNYLRRESIVLPPDVPRGIVLLTYKHLPLGFVKNIGNRCNSLYPTEWRIRNL